MHLKYKGYKIKVQIYDGDIWLQNTDDIIREHNFTTEKKKYNESVINQETTCRLEVVSDIKILIYNYIKTFKSLPQIGMQFKPKRWDSFKVN